MRTNSRIKQAFKEDTSSGRRFQVIIVMFILALLMTLLSTYTNAQSFFHHKHHSYDNRNIKTTTIGQRLRTKVKYATKRHNNIRFAYREMRRRSRAGQI